MHGLQYARKKVNLEVLNHESNAHIKLKKVSDFVRSLKIMSESPSKVAWVVPISKANSMTLLASKAST